MDESIFDVQKQLIFSPPLSDAACRLVEVMPPSILININRDKFPEKVL